ncbi:hypothetical protein DAKH74_027190 [Maudiozyma humilis]|uniref:Enoyl reductase (ER) domain-containing protein n=1 Tax=Maudiozyma humilis TaxID=51915 RepID=A0AAV5RXE8_MAUHU|nr:hypothetical protein DAKH74_027190 [Kazachstania humilis]
MTQTEWKQVSFVNRDTPLTITSEEIDLDTCFKEDEIVVEVHSAALNPADVFLHKSAYVRLSSSKPKGTGVDYSGVIVRRGAKVDPKWAVGDKVNGDCWVIYGAHGTVSNYLIFSPMAHPAIAHMAKVPEKTLSANPGASEFDVAAAWPLVFGTAYAAIFHPKRDWSKINNVLVLGASTGVGNSFVQIVKNHLKVKNVVGVCNENSIEYNKQFGFDYLVSYNNGKTLENVREVMKTKLDNEKFDVIFDSCGSTDFLPVMDEFLKKWDTGAYYSTVVGDVSNDYQNVNPLALLRRRLFVEPFRRFKPWRSYNYYFNMCAEDPEVMALANKMIESGEYVPQIDSVFSFENFRQAFDKLETGKAKGKVVIEIKN